MESVHPGVPPSPGQQRRSDIKVLLAAGIGVLLAGVIIAAAILAIVSRGAGPDVKKPLAFGLASDQVHNVRTGGPVNIVGPTGDGFWVALEHNRPVALLVKQPKPHACTLRWRGSKDTFTCDGVPVKSVQMARYRSYTSQSGPTKGLFMVALREVQPAPQPVG
jgi:hypothetical protein